MPYAISVVHFPDELIATMRTRVTRTPKGRAADAMAAELKRLVSGARRGEARFFLGSVAASMAITCDQSAAVDNTDTLTIAGGTALATVAAPANENQVAKGASSAIYAANVVAKINAHSVTSKFVWAAVTTSASGIITLYSVIPGVFGNLITVSEAGNGYTLTGSALASGTNDAVKYYQYGFARASHVAG